MKCAFGYLYCDDITLRLSASARVSVPILPTNMDRMSVSLDGIDNPAVMPVDSPTVANPEVASKSKSRNSSLGSNMVMAKVHTKTNEAEKMKMENALFSNSHAML